jgi:hypothetical protein
MWAVSIPSRVACAERKALNPNIGPVIFLYPKGTRYPKGTSKPMILFHPVIEVFDLANLNGQAQQPGKHQQDIDVFKPG